MAESFGVRAETVDGLDDAFGEALARHVADEAPSVLGRADAGAARAAAEHVAELVPQANGAVWETRVARAQCASRADALTATPCRGGPTRRPAVTAGSTSRAASVAVAAATATTDGGAHSSENRRHDCS